VFRDDLVPFFRSLDDGFDGTFQTSKEEYPIATAIFWRRRLMSQQWANPRSRTLLCQFQLTGDGGRLFYVVCAHLEGNKPTEYKGTQRVNQVQSGLKLVEKHVRTNKLDVDAVPLILAGDLNACPGEELHELLRTGVLAQGHTFQLEQEAVCGTGHVVVSQAASQPFRLRSAALVANGREPAFSFVGNSACYALDYIYVSNSVRVLDVVDPSVAFATSDVRALFGAIPNTTIPSDHLPLIADLII
jgi:endonuclease/exonuclease/phosphatase family metal-dependent hydrolase